MKDLKAQVEARVQFIRDQLSASGTQGIVFGNSGGKDSALVGILCKMACENTLGIMMPCQSKRNFGEDLDDAKDLAEQFGIETRVVDLTAVKEQLLQAVSGVAELSKMADANIAPRLRMTTLYSIAQTRNALVAGTGNRSERFMGYFTKWGDGAFDFNPIADMTVTEIYAMLEYLNAPRSIIEKAPSAGLFEGQTDETEMGVTYKEIDDYLLHGIEPKENLEKILKANARSAHKLRMPPIFGEK